MSEDAELRARSNARVGMTLRGKYRLDRVLGVGGMAAVYAATHRNQKQFAVKMLHPELSLREDIRTRFIREGYAANSLKHAGAVAVLDDDVAEDGSAFLVMELLEGAEVEALWRSAAPVPLGASLAVIDQLLDVLVAAHSKGVVHRDIKPANLFLSRDGTLKVLDFGIARLRDAAGGDHATHTGMLLGTPAFMAPEQALGQSSDIDGQTDIWAAGATLFTLLTDRPVHEAVNAQQIMIKAATTPPRSLASVARVHPAIVAVVDRAIAFRKADRWPTAAAMRDALRKAYVAVFGEEISRSQLAHLFQGTDGTLADTTAVSRAGAPVVTGGAASLPSHTGQPVSRSAALPVVTAAGARRQRPWLLGAVGVGALGLAVLAGFELRGHASGSDSAPSASSAEATPLAPVVDRPSREPDPVPPAAVLAPSAALSLSAQPPQPSAQAPAPAPPQRTQVSAGPATVASHATTGVRSGPSTAPGTKVNCNPPYVIDAAGHRNYKPECL
jgi:serine/threonine-protein kinase